MAVYCLEPFSYTLLYLYLDSGPTLILLNVQVNHEVDATFIIVQPNISLSLNSYAILCSWTLQKHQRVHVGSSKNGVFLKDPTHGCGNICGEPEQLRC